MLVTRRADAPQSQTVPSKLHSPSPLIKKLTAPGYRDPLRFAGATGGRLAKPRNFFIVVFLFLILILQYLIFSVAKGGANFKI